MTRRVPTQFVTWPSSMTVGYGPYRAVVEHHVDGDTFDALIDFGFNRYDYHAIRVLGIDCPESNRPESRAAGLAALDFFAKLMPIGTPVVLYTSPDPDSFGRYLARVVMAGNRVLGDLILAAGHAVPK
jgi:endonuclease YncB( thermonuclease family)